MEPRSKQGRAVLAAVQHLDHPDADAVFQEVRRHAPKVSLGTVYRNLDRLVETGAIRAWQVDGTRRYDPNVEPHLHLHDSTTGRLIDMPLPSDLEAEIRALCDDHFIGQAQCTIELRGTLKETSQ